MMAKKLLVLIVLIGLVIIVGKSVFTETPGKPGDPKDPPQAITQDYG
jgi:hypothetical protein